MLESVMFHGRGLHSGRPASILLERRHGPLLLSAPLGSVGIRELKLVRTDRGVQVTAPRIELSIDLVEHLFGALAGLGIRTDVRIYVRGGEVPLLDGGARELAHGLLALAPRPSPPVLRVTRSAELAEKDSVYRFEPADDVRLGVDVEFPELGSESAHFDGSRQMFLEQIAPARTFGFARDRAELGAHGRAQHVDPRSVMVFDDDGHVLPPGRERQPGELARHKLLDLLGDLYFYGGPPQGEIHVRRPGHGANHSVARRALKQGILAAR